MDVAAVTIGLIGVGLIGLLQNLVMISAGSASFGISNSAPRELAVQRTRSGEAREGRIRQALGIASLYFDEIAAAPAQALDQITTYIAGRKLRRLPLVPPDYNRKPGLPKPAISPEARVFVVEAMTPQLERWADHFRAYGEVWLRRYVCYFVRNGRKCVTA